MTIAIPQSVTMRVPLVVIDDPAVAMRSEMRDDEMEALMDSIRANGLLQAIGLKPKSQTDFEILLDRIQRNDPPFVDGAIRLEVVYGHRRTVAHRFLEAADIEAKIYLGVDVKPEAFKVAENLDRENTNPVAEARFLAHLLKEIANNDVEELCRIVRRNFEWVSSRLLLLDGDDHILAALERDEISLGVARELNRITSPHLRRLYTDQAKNTGCTRDAARQWRIDANHQGPYVDPALDAVAASGIDEAPISTYRATCICCGRSDNMHEMSLVHLHGYCKKAILDPLLAGGNG